MKKCDFTNLIFKGLTSISSLYSESLLDSLTEIVQFYLHIPGKHSEKVKFFFRPDLAYIVEISDSQNHNRPWGFRITI